MNKRASGDGVRRERHDHEVVAATVSAKERLRETFGDGEEVRQITALEAAELELKLADAEWNEAERACREAADRRNIAERRFRKAYDMLAKLREADDA